MVGQSLLRFLEAGLPLTSRWAEDMLQQTEGLDERTRQKAEFYLRQVSSALSPSNFPMTNPEVLRETLRTNARESRAGHGASSSTTWSRSGDLLKISQTDATAFEVGRNLATTPGKVVFQNELLQLIQYTPTTEKVHERPLLIVPPWINKYYILDLTPAKSLIKFVVDQGFTVFVDLLGEPGRAPLAQVLRGLHAGRRAHRGRRGEARDRRREDQRARLLRRRHAARRRRSPISPRAARSRSRSATFLADPGRFLAAPATCCCSPTTRSSRRSNELMAERGYLDGSRMANVFNMMRPRDLIWPYIVNNYLLGKKPFPFDLLFWNQDSTRMAAANHNFYLREFYDENRLAKGQMVMAGMRLDLEQGQAAGLTSSPRKEDHIAPAKSVFIGAQLFGGPVEFVLAGSGHIAGVVNPPDKVKYQYWTSKKRGRDRSTSGSRRRDGASGLVVAALDRVARRAFRRLDRARASLARRSASSRTRRAPTSRQSRRRRLLGQLTRRPTCG